MRHDQKRILKLISRAEAVDKTIASTRKGTIAHEYVAVDEACGRILAEDITAPRDLPPCDRAAMDGYAVRSRDTAGASSANPVRLVIAGKVFPSDGPFPRKIVRGQCIYASTGAPLPEGSDAVDQVEKTRLVEEAIEVVQPVPINANVSVKGEEVKQGVILFNQGHVVAPQDIGMLLALGIRSIRVVRKPNVGIISVGDELTDAYEERENKVVNDHAYIIAQLLRQLGAEPKVLGVVPDDPQLIKTKIGGALRDADIVITIAGSSVGTRDFVPDVVASLGRTAFQGVAVTPGKVTGLGIVDEKHVVMLPGYLMSALAGFYMFVVPVVNLLLGLDVNCGLPVVEAKLKTPTRSKHGLERFQLLQLSRHGSSYFAAPIEAKLAAMMDISKANAYTIISKGQVLREGERVIATLLAPSEFRRIGVENSASNKTGSTETN